MHVLQICSLCNNFTVTDGLRARKQQQTRDAIHRAAVTLAREVGIEGATVAEISARANISSRTFFNYYPRKEDAIVGFHEGLPSDDELADLREGGADTLIDDIVRVMLTLLTTTDDELRSERRAVIAEHPNLIQRQWVRLHGVEQRTAQAVSDRMRASGAFAHLDDIDLAALVLVVTCSSMLRLSVRTSLETDDHDGVESLIDKSLDALRDVLRSLR